MSRLLLVNRQPDQRRVALIENGTTVELFFERTRDRGIVGNVYKGRVVRVLPGMQAAFVEIGLARSGFLFVGDVATPEDMDTHVSGNGGSSGSGRGSKYPPIRDLLVVGQQVLVQVAKAPMGTKGARLTAHITLPGRHLVYMPETDHIAISRRIKEPEERARLKALSERLKPDKGGLIFRTACEGVEEKAFTQDLAFLEAMWADIKKRALVATAPELVNEDVDLTLRSVRDLMQNDIDRIVVDDDAELTRIQDFITRYMPGFEVQLERWDSDEPMLARYGVEWEITRAVRRKVWLKSGGYILIDRTEALISIDVNTGRYVGKSNLEDTIVDINLEAVREIAYQLRLRDIGGIIVIDFIDMDDTANQKRVTDALREALGHDRAPTKVLPISGLGLVEMTRKRVRNSIVQELTEPCFYCEGKGYLRSMQMIAESLILNMHQQLVGTEGRRVDVRAHPYITELLVEECQEELTKVEQLYGAALELTDEREFHVEHFSVRVLSADDGAS